MWGRKRSPDPEAKKARERAQRELDEAKAQWPKVRRVSNAHSDLIAEAIEQIIRGET